MREGRSWPCALRRQGRIDAPRTGWLDPDDAAAPYDRHGSDDLTGWIYDHLFPHAEKVKVAHPVRLRAIAAAKKKNDKIARSGSQESGLRACREVQPNGSGLKTFPNKETAKTSGFIDAQAARSRRSRLGEGTSSRGPLRIVSGLAENTNSIICDDSLESEAANGCPVLHRQEPRREAKIAPESVLIRSNARSPKRPRKTRAFRLTLTYMDVGFPDRAAFLGITSGYVWSAVRLQGKAKGEKTSLRKCIRSLVGHSAPGQDELRAHLSL